MTIRKVLIILLLTCFTFVKAEADTIPHYYIGLRADYGFIIPHSKSIAALSDTYPYGFELSLNKLHTSNSSRQVFNAYRITGIQAAYYNFQNPDVTGSAYALTIYSEPVVAFSRVFRFTLRGGIGISYNTKIYDEILNPSNMFFSTKINFPVYVNANFKYRLNDYSFITFSACYNHISNGGFKLPNKGMNFPMAAAGFEYYPGKIPVLNHDFKPAVKAVDPGLKLFMQMITTLRILDRTDSLPEKRVFVHGYHARVEKYLGRVYSLNAGAEMIMDGYIKETLRRNQVNTDYKRVALTAGQGFLFGNILFSQHFGVYVYSPHKARHPVYQKYDLAYRVNQNMFIGVFMKAHAQVAELMGLTLNLKL